jgi:drug/metabolite transporter (DMT)-like permease
MSAVLGGLGAAACFAASTLCSSRTSRMIGPASALGWVALVGLAVAAPAVLFSGVPRQVDGATLAWLALSGTGNAGGLLLSYAGLRRGMVGIVAPIVSTEGAVAAVIAVGSGERLRLAAEATLLAIAAGVALVAVARDAVGIRNSTTHRGAALFAAGAALAFGASLFATAKVGRDLSLAWAILPSRLVGAGLVALPLAAGSRLRITRAAAPLVLLAGLCEVAGFASYTLGARSQIAVSAVIASMFASVATVAAYLLFGERLGRRQKLGVVTIAFGVAAMSALQA